MRTAERLSKAENEADAQAALRMCTVLHDGEDSLLSYLLNRCEFSKPDSGASAESSGSAFDSSNTLGLTS